MKQYIFGRLNLGNDHSNTTNSNIGIGFQMGGHSSGLYKSLTKMLIHGDI